MLKKFFFINIIIIMIKRFQQKKSHFVDREKYK